MLRCIWGKRNSYYLNTSSAALITSEGLVSTTWPPTMISSKMVCTYKGKYKINKCNAINWEQFEMIVEIYARKRASHKHFLLACILFPCYNTISRVDLQGWDITQNIWTLSIAPALALEQYEHLAPARAPQRSHHNFWMEARFLTKAHSLVPYTSSRSLVLANPPQLSDNERPALPYSYHQWLTSPPLHKCYPQCDKPALPDPEQAPLGSHSRRVVW